MAFDRFDYLNYLRQHAILERHRFQPLFEAIENAFNSVEDGKRTDGCVRIIIRRANDQKTFDLSVEDRNKATPPELSGFEVIDNGVGFTDARWEAFETVYTKFRAKTGGKGIGRLSYLQAFERAEIESHFVDDGKGKTRCFVVERTDSGTGNHSLIDEDVSAPKTIVRLVGFHSRLRANAPKRLDAIASEIVKQFFLRLSMPGGIACIVEDEWGGQPLDLKQFCVDEFVLDSKPDSIRVTGNKFSVTHTRCRTRVVNRHEVQFCADGRVVRSLELPTSFTTTRSSLKADGKSFYYVAFVSGKLLDKHVSDDRLGFSLPERDESPPDDSGLAFPSGDELPSLEAIAREVGDAAQRFLQSVLDPLREAHRKRIEEFCRRNVVFRPLLKHRKDKLLLIPAGMADTDFEHAVWGIYHEWKADIRSRFKMAETVRQNAAALSEYREKYSEILRDLSEMAFHELAGYVTDRRAVIDFLDDRLGLSSAGRFQDEDAIHDIFFPRRQTSDDIGWDESNLWLIDERLAYQQFVASDIEWSRQEMSDSVSQDRPDVAIYYDKFFDATFAFAGGDLPFTSVTLIEFKKPERTRYTDTENPVFQVVKYIREIRSGKAITDDRHTFRVHPASPIHVYVVCHIVEELRPYLASQNPIEAPDGQGFIFHLGPQNALVQFVSFEKLIADAKKRNEAFFRKLGIDG